MEHIYTDCRTETGVTEGLVIGLIAIARTLAKRDLSSPEIQSALRDLRNDEDIQKLTGYSRVAELEKLLLECFENAIAPLGCGETIKPDKDSESLAQRVFNSFEPKNKKICENYLNQIA